MGEKRKKLCRILSAFMLCISLAACARLFWVPYTERAPADQRQIYLDAGHGGFDLGAVGKTADGTRVVEKELSLAVVTASAAHLSPQGCAVTLSRTGDERLTYTTAADEVRARRASAKAQGVDLLLSVHANAYAGEGRAYGPRVYYNPASEPSRAVAAYLSAAITRHTAAACGRECRTVPDGTYYMLGDPTLPAVLIELGFLSDEAECTLLADGDYQQALATAIAEGVTAARDAQAF